MDKDFLNESKPLTELSRKAEEEVNHLTKTTDSGSSKNNILLHSHNNDNKDAVGNKNANTNSTIASNNTAAAKSPNKNSTTETATTETAATKQSINKNINNDKNTNTISKGIRINETLAILDKSVGGIIKSNKESQATTAHLNNTASTTINVAAKKKSFQSETKKANSTGGDAVTKVTTPISVDHSVAVAKPTSAVVGDEGLIF